MIEELIKHYENEFTYIPEDRNKDKQDLFLKFLNSVKEINPNINMEGIKNIVSTFSKYLISFVFVPLTLKEGEFIHTKFGESTNRRNSFIRMDTVGIFYTLAYRVGIVNMHSSFTGKIIDIANRQDTLPLNNRIYLVAGKFLTNIYFDKAYLWERTINSHSYTPNAPIPIKVDAIVYNNYYIAYIDILDNKFSTLKALYDLKFKRDEDKFLENFNVKFNIQINGISTT